jgi:hypothetical protein
VNIVVGKISIAIGISDLHVLITKLISSAAIDGEILIANITNRNFDVIGNIGIRIVQIVRENCSDSFCWREDCIVRHTTSWSLASSAIIRISDVVVQVECILEAWITSVLTFRASGILRTSCAKAIELVGTVLTPRPRAGILRSRQA